MKNVIKGWKSTVIGLLIIGTSIFSIFRVNSITWTDILVPLSMGITLLFSPDTLINKISSYITKNKNETPS